MSQPSQCSGLSASSPATALPFLNQQRVFISDELRKTLNQYLAQISQLDDSKAFIRSSRTMGHFSNISLNLRFKAIYAQAGIGMATIQQAMGHANIATTAGYCWVSDEQLANAVNVI